MLNPITNRRILFLGEEIPVEKLVINNKELADSEAYDLPPKVNNGTFLSDCEGAIKKVIFTVNSKESEDVKDIIKTFILKRRKSIQVFVFVEKHIFDSWELQPEANVEPVYDVKNIASKWIQDQIMVVEHTKNEEKQTLFVVSKQEDLDFVNELSEKFTGERVKTTEAILVGGNMIRFGDYLLVGINSVERENGKRNFVKFMRQITRLETRVKKYNLNFIGDYSCLETARHLSAESIKLYAPPPLIRGCQATFMKHIDLLIMPIDANRVLIGLPEMVDFAPVNSENTEEFDKRNNEICKERRYLKELANQIPVETIFVDIPYSYSKGLYGYYTNSIIDNYMGQITAYVPTYAMKTPSFEQLENQFLYKLMSMGIQMRKMADFSHITRDRDGGGALRCMMKVIERT